MKKAILLIALALNFVYAQKIESIEAFTFYRAFDAFTDEDTSYISTPSIENGSVGSGVLTWYCSGSIQLMDFQTNEFINSTDGSAPVRYRLDTAPVENYSDWITTAENSTVRPKSHTVLDITEKFLGAEAVLIEAVSYDGKAYQYQFSLSGLSEALSRLTCKPLGA